MKLLFIILAFASTIPAFAQEVGVMEKRARELHRVLVLC